MQITDGGNDSGVSFSPGPASRFKWVAAGPNPCPRCKELDGDVRTLESWEGSVMPGLHKHCRCKLICVEQVGDGWTYDDQFPHQDNVINTDSSISHDPGAPGPDGDIQPLLPIPPGISDMVLDDPNQNLSTGFHGQ